MKRFLFSSEKTFLFGYFLFHIVLGTFLLHSRFSWSEDVPLLWIDSLFTAVSAVCVTGLATIDTTSFSMTGQWILLYLIQAGGLGIITFSTLILIVPGTKISMKNRKIIREYYSEESGVAPRKIIKSILVFTFLIEITGAILLSLLFFNAGDPEPIFNGIFHSISAFCNAGFSRYSDSLIRYQSNWSINLVLMSLILLGGLGFMTIWDSLRKMQDWRVKLQLHTKVMLVATPVLIVAGWISYLLLEGQSQFAGFSTGDKILVSLFQSITTRTAGFNTVDQAELGNTSYMVTLLLMIIGGGSGSTAGGLKVTTAVLLFLVFVQKMNPKGESHLFNRRISQQDLSRASMLFLKAMALLFLVILLLTITERNNSEISLQKLIFESFSALGTVGLSQGITQFLSPLSKVIIILTMFAGRVGLFSLIMPDHYNIKERNIDFPRGEVLIG